MVGRRSLAVVQAQPVHAADHRAADAPALATVAFADRAARAEPHLRHGGARAHHRIRGRRGGNAHVRGRAGRVFRGARGVRIHDHRLRHGVVVGVRDRDHRGIWRLLAGHLPRQDHCGGADVHRHRVDRYCDGHAGLVDRGSGQSGDGSARGRSGEGSGQGSRARGYCDISQSRNRPIARGSA